MGEFFVYILKSSVCLAMFYLFYRLLLSRETFHRFNRMALLGLIVLSVLIPFCQFITQKPVAIQEPMLNLEALLQMAQEQTVATAPDIQSIWLQLLFSVYIGGCVFFLIRFVLSAWMIVRLIAKGEKKPLGDDITLVITSQPVGPFSWGNYIVISRKDMESNESEIIAHETAHIQAGHSWDMLILSFCTLLHWFNPAAWLLKRELQNIHEYEADAGVLNKGADPREYQLLLIRKSVGSQRFTAVVNSFSHSELKKRITMMLRQKSNPWARLKYICVLPLTAVAVLAFARPEVTRELDRIAQVKLDNSVLIEQPAQAEQRIAREPAPSVQQKKTETKKKEAIRVAVKDSSIVDTQSKAKKESLHITMTATENKADVRQVLVKEATTTSFGTQKIPTLAGQERKWTLDTVPSSSGKASVKVVNTLRFSKSNISKDKQPLVIVDGKEQTYDTFETMNPQQIESISILKDGTATGLYGEKANNGVIIVKTIRNKK